MNGNVVLPPVVENLDRIRQLEEENALLLKGLQMGVSGNAAEVQLSADEFRMLQDKVMLLTERNQGCNLFRFFVSVSYFWF